MKLDEAFSRGSNFFKLKTHLLLLPQIKKESLPIFQAFYLAFYSFNALNANPEKLNIT